MAAYRNSGLLQNFLVHNEVWASGSTSLVTKDVEWYWGMVGQRRVSMMGKLVILQQINMYQG